MSEDFGSQDTGAQITEEGVQRMRARLGVLIPRNNPWCEIATVDGFRHFANGIGDDNQLWCDSLYGPKTRWGDNIAPPTFFQNMGVSEVREIPPEVRARGAGALAGVHGFYSGDEWEWYRPLYPGDRLTVAKYLYDLQEKQSAFANKSVLIREQNVYRNQHREISAVWRRVIIYTERATAADKGKYTKIERPSYTPELLNEIYDAYENEVIRGSQARYWEEVNEGDELPKMAKGPMLLTDIIAWCQGWASPYISAFKLRYKYMKRHPRALTMNEFGVPDVVERVHWDDDWSQKIGNPYAYDYGYQRNAMLVNLLTNWMGDDAWLWKFEERVQLFNYVGDVQWITGKIVRKYKQDRNHVVDIEIRATNQREEVTTTGKATVLLPSRDGGEVILPDPPSAKDLEYTLGAK